MPFACRLSPRLLTPHQPPPLLPVPLPWTGIDDAQRRRLSPRLFTAIAYDHLHPISQLLTPLTLHPICYCCVVSDDLRWTTIALTTPYSLFPVPSPWTGIDDAQRRRAASVYCDDLRSVVDHRHLTLLHRYTPLLTPAQTLAVAYSQFAPHC